MVKHFSDGLLIVGSIIKSEIQVSVSSKSTGGTDTGRGEQLDGLTDVDMHNILLGLGGIPIDQRTHMGRLAGAGFHWYRAVAHRAIPAVGTGGNSALREAVTAEDRGAADGHRLRWRTANHQTSNSTSTAQNGFARILLNRCGTSNTAANHGRPFRHPSHTRGNSFFMCSVLLFMYSELKRLLF